MTDEMKAFLSRIARVSKEMDELERKESRFWWHWQNLKKDLPKAWLHGRAWLHHRPAGVFGVEWVIPTRSFGVHLFVGGMEDQLRFNVSCRLFGLYFSLERWPWLRKWKAANHHGKETSFAIHHWTFWWRLWHDEHEWKSTTPKWRHGSFTLPDFFLGKAKYTRVNQGSKDIVIEMPERAYPATLTFSTSTWKRRRWPWAKRVEYAEIEVEGGVPIPGKGENSWDCDDDAIFSSSMACSSEKDAIERFIQSANHTRERYGGKNWLPEKA